MQYWLNRSVDSRNDDSFFRTVVLWQVSMRFLPLKLVIRWIGQISLKVTVILSRLIYCRSSTKSLFGKQSDKLSDVILYFQAFIRTWRPGSTQKNDLEEMRFTLFVFSLATAVTALGASGFLPQIFDETRSPVFDKIPSKTLSMIIQDRPRRILCSEHISR